MWQRGKSDCCKKPIAIRYIIIEFLSALLWSFSFFQMNDLFSAVEFALLGSLMMAIVFIDWDFQIIPTKLIWIGLVLRLLLGGVLGQNWDLIFRGGFIAGIFFFAIYWLSYFPKKREGLGFGDVRLAVFIGAWVGLLEAGIVFFLGSFFALVFWIFLSVHSGFDRNRKIPFAPFLGVATIIVELLSQNAFFSHLVLQEWF